MAYTRPTLYLLDAYALIYRAHFAFIRNPRINSKKMNTSASFGFTNSLLEILGKEDLTHIGVAFDMDGPTQRHEDFADYKANRQEQPEDITRNIPFIRRIVEGFGIPILEKEGFEADDVIGTLSQQACKQGFDVYMVTPDKDYGQLVNECVFMYKPGYQGKPSKILGVEEIKQEWGIERPEQLIDILGLMGDSVDNIPGVPGIGPKTAAKLIQEYGSVANLLENLDKLKGKTQKALEENAQQATMSRQLAEIFLNAPVDFDPEALKKDDPKEDLLMEVFTELEFRTLARRIFNVEIATGQSAQQDLFASPEPEGSVKAALEPLQDISTTQHEYHFADTEDKVIELLERLKALEEFAFDTETNQLEPIDAEMVGMSFSWKAGEAWYVPMPKDKEQQRKALLPFKSVLEDESIRKIGQNLKYDMLVLANYGIQLKGEIFDTMLAHYIMYPGQRHNMDVLAEQYLNYKPVSIETLIGKKGKSQKSMAEVDQAEIAEYAAEDADITFQLKEKLQAEIREYEMENLLVGVEGKLSQVLAEMEWEGVYVNTNTLSDLSREYGNEIIQRQERIYDLAGESFNIGSPAQLGVILFDKLKLVDKPKKTKTGQYSTSEEVLQQLAAEHEIVRLVLEYREFSKLKSTYIDSLPDLINKRDNRIHTSFNQAVAATGRLSSTNPNLQNIPIRTEHGQRIRKAFEASGEDSVIFSADYSQIELRIMADFAKDQSMIEAFAEGRDIHTATAAKVFKVKESEVNRQMRSSAKTVNFGIIYGITPFGLSQRMNIPKSEASEIIDSYFKNFPSIKEYMDFCIEEAKKKGYAETILKRRRYLPDIHSRNFTTRGFAERTAINTPIQGSAADIIKMAMIKVYDWMKKEKLQSKMVLQVHDELVFDAKLNELEELKGGVENLMKNALPLSVPMEIGMGTGKNWLEAH